MNAGPCSDVCALGYDGDPCDFYTDKTVTARKEYKCCECHEPILKGEDYHRASGKFDGSMFLNRTCLLCLEIAKKFSCGQGWMFGGVWAGLREGMFDRMTTGCLEGLSAKAKAKVVDRWREWKGFKV